MNLFGSQPQEKAMQILVHEINRLSGELFFNTKELSNWLSAHAKTINQIGGGISSEPYIRIEYLKKVKEELAKTLDSYYEKFKNDFPET